MLFRLKEKLKDWWFWIFPIAAVVMASTLFFGADVQPVQSNGILWNQEVIEKRDFDALHYRNFDGSITAIFGAGLNYKDANGNFQRVRPSLIDKGTYFGMESAKADLRLPKTFKNPKQLAGESWNHTVDSNDVPVEQIYLGDQIDGVPIYGLIYREAYNGVDVIYKPLWKGVHEDYVIKSSTSTHSFQIDKPIEAAIKQVVGRKEISAGKLTIKDFFIINKDGKRLREPHNLLGQTNDLEPSITEVPPKIVINVPVQPDTDYPITLDPSPFDSDADNSAFYDVDLTNDQANGTAWATLHNETAGTGVTVVTNPADAYLFDILNMYAGADQHERIRRLGHFINTSSIGSGSTISSSTYKIEMLTSTMDCAGVGETANDAAAYILVNSKLATSSIPVAGDFELFGDTLDLERGEQLGPEINMTTINGGKFVVLYSTTTYTKYISLTGTTTLGLVVRGDQSDVNPNTFSCGNNYTGYQGVSTSFDTVEANRPILLVAYTAAAGAAPVTPNNKYIPGFMGWLINYAWAK